MGIKHSNPNDVGMYWRPNYEGKIVGAWLIGGVCSIALNPILGIGSSGYIMGGLCFLMGLRKLPEASKIHNIHKNLRGKSLEFIGVSKLLNLVKKNPDSQWLGEGFEWENRHTQRVYDMGNRDISSIVGKMSLEDKKDTMGQTWIHGIEPKAAPIVQPLKHAEGHTLLAGTTGSGKTRAFDILISQAIARGDETVIILDPKGDKEMMELAKKACIKYAESQGETNGEDRFVYFHPAFPEHSARINPLKNFNRPTELATRIASLIQAGSGGESFKSFAQMAINNIVQGLLLSGKRPSLVLIRHYIGDGAAPLVVNSVRAYGVSKLGASTFDELFEPFVSRVRNPNNEEQIAQASVNFYKEVLCPEHVNPDLEGLITMFSHDKVHFSKMISVLKPLLDMLTSGDMADLLSPDASDMDDERLITDSQKIIGNAQVCYIGLDSLSDSMVGSAVGSMFLSDLAAVAGDRYNYGVNNNRVNIYVDEAAEIVNDRLIQILNKGRGAGFSLTIATQSIADFAATLGSKDKATQVLANINNIISLRVLDPETQEFICDGLPVTRIKQVMRTQGVSTHGEEPGLYNANLGERLIEVEVPLFPKDMLGSLPNLEYIARLSGGHIYKGRLPILTYEEE